MPSLAIELVDSILRMPGEFADVALQGPVEFALVATGALLVGVASAAFGGLALGGVVSWLTPRSPARVHRPADR